MVRAQVHLEWMNGGDGSSPPGTINRYNLPTDPNARRTHIVETEDGDFIFTPETTENQDDTYEDGLLAKISTFSPPRLLRSFPLQHQTRPRDGCLNPIFTSLHLLLTSPHPLTDFISSQIPANSPSCSNHWSTTSSSNFRLVRNSLPRSIPIGSGFRRPSTANTTTCI